MRELSIGEIESVDGGVVPVVVWVAVTVGSAVIGAVGGYLAGSSSSASMTITASDGTTAEMTCSSSDK